jgi:predicted lipoprotein with Yx(FWY)xxD motif
MPSRTSARLALSLLLAVGVGLATEATAFASAPGKHAAAAAEKKKKKTTTIKVATSSLGKIIVDSKGRSLYAFDPDGTNIDKSNCTGGCNGIWPALKASKSTAGKGLDKSLLKVGVGGQVAYNGHLLYRYAADKPGDTGGQGIADLWHVVGTDGEPVKTAPGG